MTTLRHKSITNPHGSVPTIREINIRNSLTTNRNTENGWKSTIGVKIKIKAATKCKSRCGQFWWCNRKIDTRLRCGWKWWYQRHSTQWECGCNNYSGWRNNSASIRDGWSHEDSTLRTRRRGNELLHSGCPIETWHVDGMTKELKICIVCHFIEYGAERIG